MSQNSKLWIRFAFLFWSFGQAGFAVDEPLGSLGITTDFPFGEDTLAADAKFELYDATELSVPEALSRHVKIEAEFKQIRTSQAEEPLTFGVEFSSRVEIKSNDIQMRTRDEGGVVVSEESDKNEDHDLAVLLSTGSGIEADILKLDVRVRKWPRGNPYLDPKYEGQSMPFEKMRDFEYVGGFEAESMGQFATKILGKPYLMQYVFDDLLLAEIFEPNFALDRASLRPLVSDIARMRKSKGRPVSLYSPELRRLDSDEKCSPRRSYEHVYQTVRMNASTLILSQKFCANRVTANRLWSISTYRFTFNDTLDQLTHVLLKQQGNIDHEGKNRNGDLIYEVESHGPFIRNNSVDRSIYSKQGFIEDYRRMSGKKAK